MMCKHATSISTNGTASISILRCDQKLLEMKEEEKKERKTLVKKECIDKATSVESMKKVERMLWLTHYDMLW